MSADAPLVELDHSRSWPIAFSRAPRSTSLRLIARSQTAIKECWTNVGETLLMKPIVTEWTIVTVGSWNLAILSPDWFARKVFGTNQIEVELVLENLSPRLRFLHQSVIVIPRTDRVIFGVREATDRALQLAEQAADRLLSELPVTPISAIGINFGFSIEDPSTDLATVFRFTDLQHFADQELVIDEASIARRMVHDLRTFNFTMILGQDGQVTFKTNYHSQVEGADAARAAIHDKTAAYRAHSERLIRTFYDSDGRGDDG